MLSSFSLQSTLEPWLLLLAEDPTLRFLQIALVLGSVIAVFFVFYTTRDILLRSHSLVATFACILLVAALPLVGFLLYLLIRPARTVKEREMESLIRSLVENNQSRKPSAPKKTVKDPSA
ncbi:MAG: PLD nuclease N-terminal domain-containing protein [Candidatus Peregrinibacteria bacterium]